MVSLTAYRQAAAGLSDEARQVLASGARVVVPLFSPRSVRLFLAAAGGLDLAGVVPVVISENARAELPPALAGRAVVAARPDGPSMMAAIGRCFPGGSP
ncbi:Uroporphyrinogen-III synthase HemD [Pseudogemmobacter humi]|uniref:Uroporphyrinogen-III synthase HemD n=1 Tax=Pseudogemmobacter humi TaxID=2483812 RepID=A0A3P5WUZ8_9RHOB|nr:Uroporphyrinogen-III synthase HemD [Pseudogemmobacter humi]